LIAVALMVVLLLAFILYRSRSADQLEVDPHAAKEIEKAKRR